MAWYHVNGCDCPVGCCDCGDTNYAIETGFVWYNPYSNELSIINSSEKYGPPNPYWFYIGEL